MDRNRNARQDGQSFIECVEKYFPWEHVSVADGEHRPSNQISQIAARELYEVFRNPLVHSGGVVAKRYGRRVAFIAHPYPGVATYKENETRIAEICKLDSYKNQRLLDIMADKSVVHTHPLYWCTRKMIEAFAADVSVQASIAERMGYT